MVEALTNHEEPTTTTSELAALLQKIAADGLSMVVYNDILDECLPKFLYFDEYYLMKGQDNLDSLKQRVDTGATKNQTFRYWA